MKYKIYNNREVLRGIKFKARLIGDIYEFHIVYANEKGVNVAKSISFNEMNYASQNSLEGKIKKIILENSANNNLPLSRKAYMSSTKLKKIPVRIDSYKFRFGQITNSAVSLDLFIELDDLLESEENTFGGTVKRVVLSNLLENPPKFKKPRNYGYYTTPYLFDSYDDTMHFVQLGHRRTVVSEEELKRNREKNKKIREDEKRKREKGKKLDKELGLDKKQNTRDLARFR